MNNVYNSTENLGLRIAYFRKENGLTQEDFAYLMDVSPRSIRAWEGGETLPKTIHLIEIANKLNVEIGRLFH